MQLVVLTVSRREGAVPPEPSASHWDRMAICYIDSKLRIGGQDSHLPTFCGAKLPVVVVFGPGTEVQLGWVSLWPLVSTSHCLARQPHNKNRPWPLNCPLFVSMLIALIFHRDTWVIFLYLKYVVPIL